MVDNDNLKVGFVCDARGVEPTYFLEMLHSLVLQDYQDWDLQLAADLVGLARMEGILQDYAARETRMQIVRADQASEKDAMLLQLAKRSRADFVMVIDKHAYLAHDALHRIVSMLADRSYLDHIVGEHGTFTSNGVFGKSSSQSAKPLLVRKSLFQEGVNTWLAPGDPSRIGYISAAIQYQRID